jgi:WD repeat-containing protein 23
MAYDPSEPEPPALPTRRQICVRDVSWHTQQPVLMSVGWASRNSGSIVARHEWKGLGKLGNHLEDWVDKQSAEYKEKPAQSAYQSAAAAATAPESRSSRARTIPGAYEDDEDEDEWTDEE